jgi:DNA-binding NtrC family response regulator
MMMRASLLDNKRILIVDDEPDVLNSFEDLLPMCDVVKASNFEEGRELLETQFFDMAVLDIMGVDGYKLLEVAKQRGVIAVMLTAHALSPEETIKSFEQGAAYYVPKEKLGKITTYLNDVLEARAKGKNLWSRWFDRFAAYYDRKFGSEWRTRDKAFWDEMGSWH